MNLEKMPNEIESPESTLIGKGVDPERSMGALSWFSIMNNISEIFSNPEFKKSIESGKYNLLIADDASGRIPALIFRKIINEIYNENQLQSPKVLFIPGQRLSSDQNISKKISDHINKYLENVHLPQTETKSLVITNTISSGKTLEVLSDALTKSGIDCDIVATSLEVPHTKTLKRKEELEDSIGRKIYTTMNYETSSAAMMNQKPYSHGVTKSPGDMISTKITGVQDYINEARKMADKISEEIIRQIHSVEPAPTDEERFKKNQQFVSKYWSLSEE